MADFVKVIKIKNRMCESVENCNDCPVGGDCNIIKGGCGLLLRKYPEQAQEIILKWDKEHPIKTNIDKFREVFELTEEEFNPDHGCQLLECGDRKCDECPRKNFWFDEYKEPEVRE